MYQVGIVVTLADHRQVLVLAESGEIERLAVDQEPNSIHLHGAYPDALVVAVHNGVPAYQLNFKIVKVAVSWCPFVHLWNMQGAASPGAGCDLGPFSVPQDHFCLDIIGRIRVDRVIDHPGFAVEVGGDRDVGDVSRIGGAKPYVPVNPCVIEEVVPVALPFTGRGVFDDTRRDRLPMQRVVNQRGDAHLLFPGDMVGDIGLERGVPALMRHDLDIIDPDRRPMGCGLEVQHDASPLPAPRHPDTGLIPHVAEVITDHRIGCDVVKTGRHRHLAGIRQRLAEPTGRAALTLRIQSKLP